MVPSPSRSDAEAAPPTCCVCQKDPCSMDSLCGHPCSIDSVCGRPPETQPHMISSLTTDESAADTVTRVCTPESQKWTPGTPPFDTSETQPSGRVCGAHASRYLPRCSFPRECADCRRPATNYQLLTAHCSLPTAHPSLLAPHSSLLTTHYSLLTTGYLTNT